MVSLIILHLKDQVCPRSIEMICYDPSLQLSIRYPTSPAIANQTSQ